MNRRKRVSLFLGVTTVVFFCWAAQVTAQTFTNPPAVSAAVAPASNPEGDEHGVDKFGMGFRISSLGLGAEVAAQVTHSTNVRGGFNFFSYSGSYNNNGIHYDGDLRWISTEAHFDWFPFSNFAHSLHLSPGLIAYNDNHVNASASVSGGNYLTLNGVSYESDPTDPVNGTAKLSFNKFAPTFLIGLGNLVPRHGKHFSVNLEAGVAFQGSPKIALNLTGSACTGITLCNNVATNPTIQSNVQGEQTRISNDLSPFKYYPLVSLTVGYRL